MFTAIALAAIIAGPHNSHTLPVHPVSHTVSAPARPARGIFDPAPAPHTPADLYAHLHAKEIAKKYPTLPSPGPFRK